MDRLACVNVVSLPLQLLWHRHPDWFDSPMAVVDRDDPNGEIEWVDRRARRAHVRPGMRYAEALSICRTLRAGTVEEHEIREAVDTLLDHLRDFSPFVEASDSRTGLFWLDASGLGDLYDSPKDWAEAIADHVREAAEFYTSIVVGFTRFGTAAVARAIRDVEVFESRSDERRRARDVPLRCLELPADVRETLRRLGVESVGQFVQLPSPGVRRRFDGRTHRLHRRARGDLELPLQADLEEGPLERTLHLDDAVGESSRLLFTVKRELNPVLGRLLDRQRRVTELLVELHHRDTVVDRLEIRPARPTADAARLLELLRLQLEKCSFEQGIDGLRLVLQTDRSSCDQLGLFEDGSTRRLDAANRALDRLRAEFGPTSVVRASLSSGHTPEATFDWQPLDQLEHADPDSLPDRPRLVRRLRNPPRPVDSLAPPEELVEVPAEAGVQLGGPYVVSGGWWARSLHRAYYFVERASGRIDWLFWDDRRERWFQHGRLD